MTNSAFHHQILTVDTITILSMYKLQSSSEKLTSEVFQCCNPLQLSYFFCCQLILTWLLLYTSTCTDIKLDIGVFGIRYCHWNLLNVPDKMVVWNSLLVSLLKLYLGIWFTQIPSYCVTQFLVLLVYLLVYPTIWRGANQYKKSCFNVPSRPHVCYSFIVLATDASF